MQNMIQLFLMLVFIQYECNICYGDSHFSISWDHDINARSAFNPINPAHMVDRYRRRRITSAEDGLDSFFNLRTKTIPATEAVIADKLKRHVQRTTQKQYEIINMLWKKSRIFLNEDDNYHVNKEHVNKTMSKLTQLGDNIMLTTPTVLPSTRSSNIEFYYHGEDEKNENDCTINECEESKKHIIPFTIPQFSTFNRSQEDTLLHDKSADIISETIQNESYKPLHSSSKDLLLTKVINQVKSPHLINKCNKIACKNQKALPINTESTTIYDKIKFFELYDQYTEKSFNNVTSNNYSQKEITVVKKDARVKLEHVDHSSHDHDQAKLSKKHIIETPRHRNRLRKKGKYKSFVINRTATVKQVENQHTVNLTKSNIDITLLSYVNSNVSWSDYPFVAVYVNEPSHVYCDAAAISPHWLVASGACLSRLGKKPLSGAQSAFVAYCGERWWRPERVAYVKNIRLHPAYNPRDDKKHLHNIGVIQVVTSMLSACGEWAPVSVISHQSTANPAGIEASAVGWGLDRFGTKYGAADLPKIPLMIYKGILYFGSCPGSIGYSKAVRSGDGNGVKYIHCLSLPPYTSEVNDPVHGGLVLVGGKLIALYLQEKYESSPPASDRGVVCGTPLPRMVAARILTKKPEERRPWGHQSAQYTGIWHLMPWVMEVTREQQVDTYVFEV